MPSKELKIQSKSGATLDATLNTPDNSAYSKPIVILAHGFQSSKESNTAVLLESELGKLGIASLRFSFFGHGGSTGEFADITPTKGVEDVLSVVNFVKKTLGYENISIVGTSYGGGVALMAASQIEDPLTALVSKCGVGNFIDLEISTYSKDDIDKWLSEGSIEIEDSDPNLPPRRLNSAFYTDAESLDGYESAKNITTPTLLVHGDQDNEVPIEQAQKLAELIPNAKLVTIKGAGHRFDEGDSYQKMIDVILKFLKRQLL